MREILFRGKRIDNGEWVFGSLHSEYGETDKSGKKNIDYRILGMRGECDYVIPETVGQLTGLTKNGTKIFEGDIVKHYCGGINDRLVDTGVVFWDSSRCMFLRTSDDGSSNHQIWSNCRYEVIGNIHDNPELLEEGSND